MTQFGKSQKANLSNSERNELAKFTFSQELWCLNMSDVFNSIKQGLNEAVAFSNGKCPKAAVHEFSPADVKNIRSEIGMSQTEFSSAFGISSVVGWFRG